MSPSFIHKIKACFLNATALLLSFILVILSLPNMAATDTNVTVVANGLATGDVVRVGLYYASGALPTANLANSVGEGFKIGYYDDYTFIELAQITGGDGISMTKDRNLYVSSGEYYEDNPGGASLLGAYHVQLSGSYSTYREAKNVADSIDLAFVAFVDGRFTVRVDYFSSAANAQALASEYSNSSVVGGSSTCITICKIGTNQILFEYDDSNDTKLAVEPIVYSGEKGVTWFKSNKYYGGFQYYRAAGNDITVINYVDIDDYVTGVVPYEMTAEWSLEALKAQAVCARTYALASTKHLEYGFDVCCSTNCQVYRGVYTGTFSDNVDMAVYHTSGQCIYYDGELIEAYYHSSSGGATEDAGLSWGKDLDYLKGKVDPYDMSISSPVSSWAYLYSLSDLTTLLRNDDYSTSGVTDVYVESYTPTGNVYKLVFVSSNGSKLTFTGDEVRALLENTSGGRYFSRHFTVVRPGEEATVSSGYVLSVNDGSSAIPITDVSVVDGNGNISTISGSVSIITGDGMETSAEMSTTTKVLSSTQFAFVGSGWGHNVGMSQYGAKAMAEQGYTYDEIIKFYYTGVDIR